MHRLLRHSQKWFVRVTLLLAMADVGVFECV